MSRAARPRIGAAVVTYRRPEALAQTLDAISRQSPPVALTAVVDNDAGAGDGAVRAIVGRFQRASYIAAAENVGYGAALAIGMRHLGACLDPDYYWLLDDDSPPAPDAVRLSVEAYERSGGDVGAVADRGGHVRGGRIVHDLQSVASGRVEEAEFTLVDGALIARAAVSAIGYPRSDLFMMLEDFEYTTRIRSGGFRLLVRARDATLHRHLGAGPAWRGYYQARNLLRIALERRARGLLWGWLLRESAILAVLAWRGKHAHIRMRARGWRDGVLGRMGRTVVPT